MEFTTKHYVIAGYIVITLLVSGYLQEFSNTSNKSYAYNLGAAVVWPISLVFFHHV